MIENRAERPAFGTLLRRHRIEAGLSQEMLAERARLSVQAVSALERGARSAPRPSTLALLVETLSLEGAERAAFEETARVAVKTRVRSTQPLLRTSPARPPAVATEPHFTTPFVGRTGDLHELETLIRPGRCTTLWGTGGIGKTRLAVELSQTLRDAGRGTITFVPLGSTVGDEAVEGALASALGVAVAPGSRPFAAVEAALAERGGTLVIDNCEHVISGAATLVENVLSRVPGVAVLCTSREPLRVQSERIFRMKTLELADAVRLFTDRATAAASVTSEPSVAETRSIETICRRLDGLPLSLELAAGCTRALDVADLARALDARFDVLTRGSRTVDARHMTLRATIAWSYDLLEPCERTVFRRIAAINGRFTFDDAIAVATGDAVDRGAAIASLAALVDKALVVLDVAPAPADRTYRLFESTRAFAAQVEPGPASDTERDAAMRRLGAHLVESVVAASDASRSGDDAAIRRFDVNVLRGYLEWAIAAGDDAARGTLLAGRLMIFWDFSGLHAEGLRWIEAGLARLDPLATDPLPALAGLIGKARLLQRLQRFVESTEPAMRAYEASALCGNLAYRAASAFLLAMALTSANDHERAFAFIEEAAANYELAGDRMGSASAGLTAAIVAFRSGRHETGRALYAQGIESHRRGGQSRAYAGHLMDLAEAEFAAGYTTAALAAVRTGLESLRVAGEPLTVALGLANQASYFLDAGRIPEARASASESLQMALAGDFELCLVLCMHVVAAIAAVLRTDDEGAAELSAYVTLAAGTIFPEFGPTEKRTRDRLHAALTASLPPEALANAKARGRLLDRDAATALALDLADLARDAGDADTT